MQMHSSTWSNYKHHNTAKLLVACNPNGAVCFVSPLYVGLISDVELTRVSGFVEELHGKSGVSVMADRGFTVSQKRKSTQQYICINLLYIALSSNAGKVFTFKGEFISAFVSNPVVQF